MDIDQTTLQDLAIFPSGTGDSVFDKLNFTETPGGAAQLARLLRNPLTDLSAIRARQESLKYLLGRSSLWSTPISNGTIMVLEKYFQSQIDPIPHPAHGVNAVLYSLLHSHDFSLIRYTAGHAIDFLKGMYLYSTLSQEGKPPAPLEKITKRIEILLSKPEAREMIGVKQKHSLRKSEIIRFGYFLLHQYKDSIEELIELHSQLEALLSLCKAIQAYDLHFPDWESAEQPVFSAAGLRHLLLQTPVDYGVHLNKATNFIFLTGANMAGKSTYIKAVGIAAYLAHIGMAVPARSLRLSLLDGMLSNIQVSDNISRGESYFFNEVQRIKTTISRIHTQGSWLVLIDELFKGTNVEDAMRCSEKVITGLLKIRESLFILSTHLYEIGVALQPYPNIAFRYFETGVQDDQLHFSYRLKEGISNDRLGYLIMKREGLVDLIDRL